MFDLVTAAVGSDNILHMNLGSSLAICKEENEHVAASASVSAASARLEGFEQKLTDTSHDDSIPCPEKQTTHALRKIKWAISRGGTVRARLVHILRNMRPEKSPLRVSQREGRGRIAAAFFANQLWRTVSFTESFACQNLQISLSSAAPSYC